MLIASISLSPNGMAQWAQNPSENIIICDHSVIDPNIYSSDNSIFITYMATVNSKQHLYLRRLDQYGYSIDLGQSVQLSLNSCKSYSAIFHSNNSFIVGSSEIVNINESDVSIYKYDAHGKNLWQNAEVRFIHPGSNEYVTQIIEGSDNSLYFLISRFYTDSGSNERSEILLYKVSLLGEILWNGNPLIIEDPEYDLVLPQGMSLTDGSLMIAYSAIDSPFVPSNQSEFITGDIRVQKVKADGVKAWLRDLVVSSGDITMSSRLRSFQGNDDTFYVAWHGHSSFFEKSKAYVQGINSEGNKVWPAKGIQVAMDPMSMDSHPKIHGISSNNDLVVTYTSFSNNSYQMYAQTISYEGELNWGPNGVHFATGGLTYDASMTNDTLAITYCDPAYNVDLFRNVVGVILDKDGQNCISNEIQISNIYSSKYIRGLIPITDGQFVVILEEEKGDVSDPRLVAQNFWTDGSLGPKSTYIETTGLNDSYPMVKYFPERGIMINGINDNSYVSIIDMSGKLVYTYYHKSPLTEVLINIPKMRAGYYGIIITNTIQDNQFKTKLFIDNW